MKKNFIFLFVVCLFSLVLVACSQDNSDKNELTIKLKSHIIEWDYGKVLWEKVDNASKYEISINDTIVYTYNNYIELNISTDTQNYHIKVKSISESNLYLNSDFSNELHFATKQLKQPISLSFTINNNDNIVIFHSYNHDYDTDYYTIQVNDEIFTICKKDFTITESAVGYNCEFSIDSKNFMTGENQITILAESLNKYYLTSEQSNSLTIYKNSPYTNVRIEDGAIKYGVDSIYDVSFYTFISDTEPFPIINKEKYSESIPSGITIWSEPVYINAYKINDPTILSCSLNDYILSLTIEGYDPRFAGNNKKLIGFDYNKIEITIYNYNF